MARKSGVDAYTKVVPESTTVGAYGPREACALSKIGMRWLFEYVASTRPRGSQLGLPFALYQRMRTHAGSSSKGD